MPSRYFVDINPCSKYEIISWIRAQCIECIEEFIAACLDCEGSICEDKAYLWNKDAKLLELIGEILREKINITAEIKEKKRGNERKYHLYINNVPNEVIRRLRHPCKGLNKKCKMSRGHHLTWKWLLENFPEVLTHPPEKHLKGIFTSYETNPAPVPN